MPRPKTKRWYKKVRGSYLPISWQGWVLYLPFVVFLVSVLQTAFRTAHSVSDGLYIVFPQWVAAAIVMTWVAKQKS